MGEENKAKKRLAAHVLILPFPGGQGHINPMLQFAKRLVSSNGVKATLVITNFMLANSMHTLSDPTNSCIDIKTISDGFDEGGLAQAGDPHTYLSTFKSVGSQSLATLIDKTVDAIVYDSFLPWALDVAKQFGLFGAPFFTQTCAVNTIYYHVSKGLVKLPVEGQFLSLPPLPLLQGPELPSFVYHYDSYSAWFDMLVNQFSNVDAADCVLVNTFYELDQEVVDWMCEIWKLVTIGPTIPSMYLDRRLEENKDDNGLNLFMKPSTVDTCIISWLNSKPKGSVVYVSFGSVAGLGEEQMAEIALGLKASDCYFLWVVREPEQPKLPNSFKEEMEKGLIVAWCPQLEVLAHESLACFLTHCGYNSVLEALSLGVPMVAMPQWADQPTNAKYVEEVWGVGIRAFPDEKEGTCSSSIVRGEVIKRCIKEVVEGKRGKEIKENANKWKNLARKAAGKGGSTDKNIDEFVAKLITLSLAS